MIGIVAEGPADIAVLRNILKGKLGIDRDLTYTIRPELDSDATDLGGRYRAQRPEEYSNWTLVLEECRTRTRIQDFLGNQIEEESFVVVQIDTAEAHLPGYDVRRPNRENADYSSALRAIVLEKMVGLLGPDLAAKVRFAIAVEETDAWVLTIHETQDRRDTGARLNPKERLRQVLTRGRTRQPGRVGSGGEYDLYHAWSSDFRSSRRLDACAARNRSLELFVESLNRPDTGA